jgi:hypothetical protein
MEKSALPWGGYALSKLIMLFSKPGAATQKRGCSLALEIINPLIRSQIGNQGMRFTYLVDMVHG